jgi:hypothetical protein
MQEVSIHLTNTEKQLTGMSKPKRRNQPGSQGMLKKQQHSLGAIPIPQCEALVRQSLFQRERRYLQNR